MTKKDYIKIVETIKYTHDSLITNAKPEYFRKIDDITLAILDDLSKKVFTPDNPNFSQKKLLDYISKQGLNKFSEDLLQSAYNIAIN